MDNINLCKNDENTIKEMPINTVIPKCVEKKKDRVIMHTEKYDKGAFLEDCGIM